MAFFRKLFGGRDDDAYHDGITLFEQGRAEEAIPLLRTIFAKDPGSPRGSLAGYYLRQALVSEGRHRLQTGDADAAAALLEEAVRHWPEFPDLQFLAGTARGLADRWGDGLEAAKQALRRNPDYCEARFLEACALQALERPVEAAASLDQLLESGRRVDHVLVRELGQVQSHDPRGLPTDLVARLRRLAIGDDAKDQLAEAVAICRAGRWDQGLAEFARLVAEYPRYPDIRARHAAALYQIGRSREALVEAEAALEGNPRYRTAVALKGLILAELGELAQARTFLADAVPRLEGTVGRHEELFLAYLRATLALLTGELEECRQFLAGWNDLPRQFARAELMLVACDDLAGRGETALRRLEDLAEVWPTDADLQFLRVSFALDARQWSLAETILANWPASREAEPDQRPLLLRARLDVTRGRDPGLAEEVVGPEQPLTATDQPLVHPAAWRQLAIHAHLIQGEAALALDLARIQLEAGHADEETGRLLLLAAGQTGQRPPADLAGRIGAADSWGPDLCHQLRRQGAGVAAEDFVQQRRRVRPEQRAWSWLSAGFWLSPVRRWLA